MDDLTLVQLRAFMQTWSEGAAVILQALDGASAGLGAAPVPKPVQAVDITAAAPATPKVIQEEVEKAFFNLAFADIASALSDMSLLLQQGLREDNHDVRGRITGSLLAAVAHVRGHKYEGYDLSPTASSAQAPVQ